MLWPLKIDTRPTATSAFPQAPHMPSCMYMETHTHTHTHTHAWLWVYTAYLFPVTTKDIVVWPQPGRPPSQSKQIQCVIQNTHWYSLERLYVCMRVCVCVCVSVRKSQFIKIILFVNKGVYVNCMWVLGYTTIMNEWIRPTHSFAINGCNPIKVAARTKKNKKNRKECHC